MCQLLVIDNKKKKVGRYSWFIVTLEVPMARIISLFYLVKT